MAFGDFDLPGAVGAFGLEQTPDADLFADVPSLEPSPFVRPWLDELAPLAWGFNTESARSHYIIAPVLTEAGRRSAGPVRVLPGATLDVDRGRGLNGYCDFVIARSETYRYLQGPLVAVVEAKRDDVAGGLGQCAASVVALRVFNERAGTPQPALYGCVTSGTLWQFLRLSGDTLTIDAVEYHIHEAGKIIGILVHIIGTGVRAGAA